MLQTETEKQVKKYGIGANICKLLEINWIKIQ